MRDLENAENYLLLLKNEGFRKHSITVLTKNSSN